MTHYCNNVQFVFVFFDHAQGSVKCSHGISAAINWNQVFNHFCKSVWECWMKVRLFVQVNALD